MTSAGSIETLSQLLRARAETEGERELYVFLNATDQSTLSYRGTLMRASTVARQLMQQARLKKGDRALLLYPPGLDFVEAFFGCLMAGVIAVPHGLPKPGRTFERLDNIAADCEASVVLTNSATRSRLQHHVAQSPVLCGLPVLATDNTESGDLTGVQWPSIDAETIAFLQYTSGSTGDPKGVIVTHGNIVHNQQLIHLAFKDPWGSTLVGWLPTFHDMGLVGNLLHPLYIGGRCVLMAPAAFLQQPTRWLKTISQYRAYVSGAPNFAYDLCVAKQRDMPNVDLSGWRIAYNGAEPIRAETLERFSAAFASYGFSADAFYPCYGLAEATLIAAGGPAGRRPVCSRWDEQSLTSTRPVATIEAAGRKLVSCGAVLGDQEVAIVDSSTATRRRDGEIGEIWISGASVARGYWANTEQTTATFGATLDGIQWLKTGDRGFIADGELYVLGRNQEILMLFGRKYCANAIELAAERAASPSVGRCGAFVDALDSYPELLLVCEYVAGSATDEEIAETAARIKEAIAQRFDLSATITFVNVGALPRTPSGKLRRNINLTKTAFAPLRRAESRV